MDIPKPQAPKKKAPSEATKTLLSEIRGLTAQAVIYDEVEDIPKDFTKELNKALGITDVVSIKKAPFVPKPHLTQNPFRENEDLLNLKKDLEKKQPPVKRKPIRKTSTKSQEKNR